MTREVSAQQREMVKGMIADLLQTEKQQLGQVLDQLFQMVMMDDEDLITTAKAHKIKLMAAMREQEENAIKIATQARNRLKALESAEDEGG